MKAYVDSCESCQGRVRITVHDRTPIVAVHRPAKSFDMLKCDILGPIEPKSSRGHTYVLGCIDVTTRWLELIPVKNVTSQEIIDGLQSVFNRFGRPSILFTDNASYFTSKLSREVYEVLGVEFQTSTQLKASQNGLIERAWSSVKRQLHDIAVSAKPRDWDTKLGGIMWAYDNAPHSTIGVSPYHLVFGHPGATKLADFKRKLTGEAGPRVALTKSDRAYLNELMEDLERVQSVADQVAHRSQQEYEGRHNKHAKQKVFKIGERVLVLRPSSTNALKSTWIGPCAIEEAVVGNVYMTHFPDGGRKVVHASELRLFVARTDQVGVVFDHEESFGKLEPCPSTDDFSPATDDRFDKLDLSHVSQAQRIELVGCTESI